MFYAKKDGKAAARDYFKGVWAAVHTPQTPDGEIDEAGLRSNIDRLIDDWKLSGMMLNGGVGEFWSMTSDEQCRVFEIAADATKGRCGLIVMTTSTSVRECIRLTRNAQDAGIEFASTFTPFFPGTSEAGIARWFKELTDAVDIGLWLIDTGLCGPKLSLDLTRELAEIPNIVGMKVQRGGEYLQQVFDAVGDKLVLSDPHEASFLARMKQGQQVYMSAPAPMLMQRPGFTPILDYYQAASGGDWERAAEISDGLAPLRKLYERYLSNEMFQGTIAVALIKAWAAKHGLATGPVRAPLIDLPDAEREALWAEIDTLMDECRVRLDA